MIHIDPELDTDEHIANLPLRHEVLDTLLQGFAGLHGAHPA